MTIRDLRHALDVSRALHRFALHLRDDDSGDEGGMTSDETTKAVVFTRAVEATFSDVVVRQRGQGGFLMLELLFSMGIALVITGALLALLVAASRQVKVMGDVVDAQNVARARLERTVWDVCHPQPGVLVTWGPLNAGGESVVHVETSALGRILSTEVTRTPCP